MLMVLANQVGVNNNNNGDTIITPQMYDRCKMADNKRRYFDRDSREKEAANSTNNSETSRHSSNNSKDPQNQNYDDPPNSRLFILCGRNVSEDELRAAFERFGTIKELWIVKDKSSGDSKGVAYIKYAITSEAAVAMEEMNGKFIGNNAKSLKVLIANSRDQGSRREMNEEERLLRLFIIVPKSMSETELKEHFMQFGDVEHCNVVRDRNTKESKGYAYVKFHRISHAAKAYEGCDRSFKPVFADPRPQKQMDERYSGHGSTTGPYDMHEFALDPPFHQQMINHHSHSHHGSHSGHDLSSSPSQNSSSCRLAIIANGSLNQDQLWRLCDFFPGLDYCNVRHDQKSRQCFATAVYNSPAAASYAKEKLHGFEYPPGHRLIVKLECQDSRSSAGGSSHTGLLGPGGGVRPYNVNMTMMSQSNGSVGLGQSGHIQNNRGQNSTMTPDLASLAEQIAQATNLIHQAAGLNSANNPFHHHSPDYDPSYCSVKLSPPQRLAPIDSPVMERLFVVCHPSPPPLYALKDIFGRFGNLIDIFMLNGKNFGYAKYANKNSADEARSVLHGQEICGMRLKVFPAEPQEQKEQKGGAGGGNANASSSSSGSISGDQKCNKRLKMDTI